MKKSRILMVIPGSDSGSSMIFARRQAAALVKQGIECESFYLASRSFNKTFLNEGIRFKKMLKSFKPDIVHSQYGTMTSFFSAFLSQTKFIATFHGSDLNATSKSDGFFADLFGRALSNISALRASAIICVSKPLVNRLWWMKKRVTVIPVGVDTEKFCPMNKGEVRKKLHWSELEKVIVFNANNPKIKRLDIAEAAIQIVKRAYPDARLEILDGKIDPEMIPVYLNASDCLLLCSDSEGSPMIIKEALACNLPIVAVSVGDVEERIAGVNNIRLVAKNAPAVAEGVEELLAINGRTNGRNKLINDGLSEENVTEQLINIYESVL